MTLYGRNFIGLVGLCISVCIGQWLHIGSAAACQVLVVSSYHESFFRTLETNEGIEDVFDSECTLTYAYLNALTAPAGVEIRAQDILRQYQEIQPDGVIAVGEEAQKFFVVPYLREKTETPVMFNTIFFPEVYDYPASNVSGITMHFPVQDAIVFIRELVPEISTVGMLFADEPVGHALIEQISREQATYPLPVLPPIVVATVEEAVAQAAMLKEQCDALYIGAISALPSIASGALSSEQFFSGIKKAFGKATFTNLQFYVEAGLLSGVKEFGQEHGQVSAEMLRQAMSGTPIADLPIAQNQFGQRLLNKTVVKEMGLKPSRRLLMGAEIVETVQ